MTTDLAMPSITYGNQNVPLHQRPHWQCRNAVGNPCGPGTAQTGMTSEQELYRTLCNEWPKAS